MSLLEPLNLPELIAAADARALAASAVACLDRCLPQPPDGADPEPLRPLWAGCADGDRWPEALDSARTALDGASGAGAAARIGALLDTAPARLDAPGLRDWADACSLLALEVHREQEAALGADAGTGLPERHREGEAAVAGPLVAGEVHRQIRILEQLAETPDAAPAGAGLRQVLDASVEGRRVLRAVASRRARALG